MPDPTVSIILPAYNAANTIGRAFASVLAQTYTEWELIVIDDGSTDPTPAIIDSYRNILGEKLTVVSQANTGPSAARNAGIDRARGQYVCFLDADDEFLPAKLARQLELFAGDADVGLVFSDYAYVDVQGIRHASVFDELIPFVREIPTTLRGPRLHRCGPELLDRMTGHYIISTITGMVRRDVLSPEVRFPVGLLYCEEWLFFLEAARRTPAGYVDEALSLHHHTQGSVSRSSAMRNTQHRIRALEHVLARHPEASARAHGELCDQLRACHRQLGYDHFKQGAFGPARRAFGAALGYRFTTRDLCHLLEATARQVVAWPSARRAGH